MIWNLSSSEVLKWAEYWTCKLVFVYYCLLSIHCLLYGLVRNWCRNWIRDKLMREFLLKKKWNFMVFCNLWERERVRGEMYYSGVFCRKVLWWLANGTVGAWRGLLSSAIFTLSSGSTTRRWSLRSSHSIICVSLRPTCWTSQRRKKQKCKDCSCCLNGGNERGIRNCVGRRGRRHLLIGRVVKRSHFTHDGTV